MVFSPMVDVTALTAAMGHVLRRAIIPGECHQLRAGVSCLLASLLANDSVKQDRDRFRHHVEGGHEESDEWQTQSCELELVRPSKNSRGEHLAAEQHDSHRQENRRVRRNEVVQEYRQRLVRDCIEQQQRHEQQMFVAEDGQYLEDVPLIAQKLLSLFLCVAILRSRPEYDSKIESFQRGEPQSESSGERRTQDADHDESEVQP
mmetsp:Transcript_95461/g.269946  ORF Transcript_95461/g.269946 Transcript_95461/m.269946 type:complete len:204 (+) Transcript_95461:744-1355(+)